MNKDNASQLGLLRVDVNIDVNRCNNDVTVIKYLAIYIINIIKFDNIR